MNELYIVITLDISVSPMHLTERERNPTHRLSKPAILRIQTFRIQTFGAHQNISSKVRDKLSCFALPTLGDWISEFWRQISHVSILLWATCEAAGVDEACSKKGPVAVQAPIQAALPLGILT